MGDADDEPLRHSQTRKLMSRDIVQFVPYNEFKNSHMSVIARETLEEVPGQVTSFMAAAGIHPNPPRVGRGNTVDNLYGAVQPDVQGGQNGFDPNNPYGHGQDDMKMQSPFHSGGKTGISEGDITTQQPGGGGGAYGNAAPMAYNPNSPRGKGQNPYYGNGYAE